MELVSRSPSDASSAIYYLQALYRIGLGGVLYVSSCRLRRHS